ncbi:GNAT family N-acetyltransferase [Dactylosporangium sp. NPDC051541]|uniref:GNAT family N-acetyltransferase n=1 Tax=Dactylosporangium sp. NPDC051541 TaxID=3363977 RepID=UPI00379C8585
MNDRAMVHRRGMRGSLTTARLDLHAVEPDDAEALHELFSDPQTHTIGDGPLLDIRETQSWISRRQACRRELGLCWYALRERASRRLVGNCGVFAGRTGPDEPEVGYEISHAFRGVGYATEAAVAVVAECARVGLPRVWATVRPANTASLRVLEHLNMALNRSETDRKGVLHYLSRVP